MLLLARFAHSATVRTVPYCKQSKYCAIFLKLSPVAFTTELLMAFFSRSPKVGRLFIYFSRRNWQRHRKCREENHCEQSFAAFCRNLQDNTRCKNRLVMHQLQSFVIHFLTSVDPIFTLQRLWYIILITHFSQSCLQELQHAYREGFSQKTNKRIFFSFFFSSF